MATILIVDDEEDILTLLSAVLARHGHTTLIARNGHEAVRLFAAGSVDLVLCDLVMPERDGIETIRAIRGRATSVPIVAMSGGVATRNPMLGDLLVMARHLGASEVLRKPFATDELITLVKLLLPGTPA